jgi:hypothetical protein
VVGTNVRHLARTADYRALSGHLQHVAYGDVVEEDLDANPDFLKRYLSFFLSYRYIAFFLSYRYIFLSFFLAGIYFFRSFRYTFLYFVLSYRYIFLSFFLAGIYFFRSFKLLQLSAQYLCHTKAQLSQKCELWEAAARGVQKSRDALRTQRRLNRQKLELLRNQNRQCDLVIEGYHHVLQEQRAEVYNPNP